MTEQALNGKNPLMTAFTNETGLHPFTLTTDGVHRVSIEVYSHLYVQWLERRATLPPDPAKPEGMMIFKGERIPMQREEDLERPTPPAQTEPGREDKGIPVKGLDESTGIPEPHSSEGEEVKITKALYEDGVWRINAEHPAFIFFVGEAEKLLQEWGGKNYLSMMLRTKEGREFEVVVRYPEGKTPAQRVVELEAEVARLAAMRVKGEKR